MIMLEEKNAYQKIITASMRWSELYAVSGMILEGEKEFPSEYFAETVKMTYDLFADMMDNDEISVRPTRDEIGAIGYITIARGIVEYSNIKVKNDKSKDFVFAASVIVARALIDKITNEFYYFDERFIDIFPIFPDVIDDETEKYIYDVDKGDLSDIIKFIEKYN